MIDIYSRYQTGITLSTLFPKKENDICSCGCGKELSGKKSKWASEECQNKALRVFYIIKGDMRVIRNELFKRDKGKCAKCGIYTENWEADHIIPVCHGGGGCNLNNFQTLCKECHIQKSIELNRVPS